MIMETEESQDLSSINWTPRKVGGVTHSKCKGLRTREADSVNPSVRKGEGEVTCPIKKLECKAGKRHEFLLPFVPFNPRQIE